MSPSRTPNQTAHATVFDGYSVGLSVTLLSQAASLSSKPLYREGDSIAGTVHVDVRRGKTVPSITMTLQGRYRLSSSCTGIHFLDVTTCIWPPPSHPAGYTGISERDLRGISVHQFRCKIPKFCALDGKTKIPLPPTFQMTLRWVDYELICRVGRGKFSGDEVFCIPIQYRPNSVARPSSSYRLQAYETGTPIPGPELDPAGWRTTRTPLRGAFFSRRSAEIMCSFSLAEPLDFPRGYPIPFYAELSCKDTQLMDVIAAQGDVLSPTLIRRVRRGAAPDDVYEIRTSTRSWITHRGTGRVHIAGEIRAPTSLPPSFRFSGTEVQYYVRYAVQAPGLQLCSQAGDIPIVICTTPAPGPLPVSYTGPQMTGVGANACDDHWAGFEKSEMLISYTANVQIPTPGP